jgi:hypothetical protein
MLASAAAATSATATAHTRVLAAAAPAVASAAAAMTIGPSVSCTVSGRDYNFSTTPIALPASSRTVTLISTESTDQ